MAKPALLLRVLALALTSAACREPADARAQAVADPLLVVTERGSLRGTSDGQTDVFRGIPYAAPPLGQLRFRPPQPAERWEGVRDASRFGSPCPQIGLLGTVVGDEDCLTLNVARPSTPAPEARPVLVFIHGGGNAIGSNSDPLTDTGRRLAQKRDLIVVTINYRLGLLGFLAHPQLTAESGTSGNWAYLDQIAALEWVARNIAAFGGDPERVTIVGESAGALAVCVLLASPRAAGLFHAAILQSGGCDVAPLEQRQAEGEDLLRSVCTDGADPIGCARELTPETLVALAPTEPTDITNWALPVAGAIDGFVLPASPWDTFAKGAHNAVPTLVGSNAHETESLVPKQALDCTAYELMVRAAFAQYADELLAEYPCANYANARYAYVDVTTDAMFTCQARRILQSLAASASETATPLYRYYYTHVRSDPAVRGLRAYHGGELQLLFDTMARVGHPPPERERTLADAMQISWAALARSGSPIHAGTPGWEPWDPERDNAAIFGTPITAADGVGTSHCDFWDRLGQSGNR